jgi:hypothetical protein
LLIVVLASIAAHLLLTTSDIELLKQGLSWNVIASMGIGALLAAIALVGPASLKTWYLALPLSLLPILALFLIPWAYAYFVCALFGMCI